ncbi:MAG: rRNA pseudouridine synthase [Drouetiella hepatica Uher 2000/2452]|jgi:23S rRNA pseudouridine2605 synthase|uniref:Pseudouridine synthase n=1 Tax=Drouetiella hepatica Uher 2000/2452 TaxID=904376 RepID=A0A951UL00_9CYAN|nr:rRNA pseudouridine synthase [Drouetiella hepatica Uher 2000/2452]
MAERLQKILSQWGIASRRQAEQMILAGRVRLNGAIAQLGEKADPAIDQIEVDGQRVQMSDRPQRLYLLVNKPIGVVSTCDDPEGRSTVLDLLPNSLRQDTGIHPVGRLDVMSTGALLLTNDGEVTAGFTHPRHQIHKVYQVQVEGSPSPEVLQQWRQGIWLEGRLTLPAEVKVLDSRQGGYPDLRIASKHTNLEVVLREGRNRQIRRVAEQLGHPVVRLHRVAIGAINLGQLPSGQYRSLMAAEVEYLRQQVSSGLQAPGLQAPGLQVPEKQALEKQAPETGKREKVKATHHD